MTASPRQVSQCVRCGGNGHAICASSSRRRSPASPTAKARAALSPTIARKDAVFNLQRVLSLVHALQHGEYDRLREALQDRWHQPARADLVPHLGAVLAIDDPDVLGAFLSGAGPSVALLATARLRASRAAAAGDLRGRGIPGDRADAGRASTDESVMRDAVASAPGRTA